MTISIQIPERLEELLRKEMGDLDQVAKEALAIEAYRSEKLSIGQVAELLGLTVYEAEGVMKQRGINAPLTLADFEHDRATLKRLLNP